MYIERVPNRSSPPAVLLRESYRQEGKVKKRTLANLSRWPGGLVEGLRTLIKGGVAVGCLEESFEVVRSRPHGHVAAVLGTLRRLRLDRFIAEGDSTEKALCLAMIVARILDPRSKLATARGLDEETRLWSLGEMLGIEAADEDDLYRAMDWLVERQERIEARLARRHLSDKTLVLYDVTSTYFEGRTCPLARLGHNRDGKKGKLQIVFGLLCTAEGCPVAVEVFSGDTGDPSTLSTQIDKIRKRFGLSRVIWVGDRGLLTEARIREELRPVDGLDWISALRAPQIRELVEGGSLQLSLFDDKDLAEITDPAYPAERLIVCHNPFMASQRARKRRELLEATQTELDKIVLATTRAKRPLRGKDKIGLRVGKVLGRFKMAKHFELDIRDDRFSYWPNERNIAQEASLDGIYVLRTSVRSETLDTAGVVRAYKGLSVVEQAFRSCKSIDLKVRPIYHRLQQRVRAHVLLCMLAYYVEWHMRKALAPILFDDHDPQAAQIRRISVVAPAERSPAASRKARTKRTEDDLPVHSFHTLIADLGTIVKDRIEPRLPGTPWFDKVTIPTPVQTRALKLLGVRL
jgi:transposase